MCLNWLQQKICINYCNKKVPEPEVVGSIDNENIDPILRGVLGDIPILYGDKYYQIVTMESFQRFLKHDDTDKYSYIADRPDTARFDCNSYSTRICGNLSIPGWASSITGQIWLSTPNHSMVLFVDEELDVYYVEGQTDQVIRVTDRPQWIPRILWLS